MTDQPTPLTQIILSFLTPLMLAAGITDSALAQRAAQEAIAAGPPGSVVTTAQVVAFAMAALDSLRLSVTEPAVTTKLRLRGNANALSRSSQRAAAAVTPPPRVEPIPPPAAAEPDRGVERAWADAMTDVAAECSRRLAKLPPKQRRAEVIRIAALNETVRQIRSGQPTETSPRSCPA